MLLILLPITNGKRPLVVFYAHKYHHVTFYAHSFRQFGGPI